MKMQIKSISISCYNHYQIAGQGHNSEDIEKLAAITRVLHKKYDDFSFHVNRQASQPSSSATDVIVKPRPQNPKPQTQKPKTPNQGALG